MLMGEGEGFFPLLIHRGNNMNYLFVTGASDNRGISKRLLNAVSTQTDGALYSLVDGLNKKDFGCVSMSSVAQNINTCFNPFVEGSVDSGGYSIIKGDVHPQHIIPAIDCWEYYGKHEYNEYDFLFSLDIPVSLKYDELNTRDKIFHYNRLSLITLIKLIEKVPGIADKLFFVEQFKMIPQYEIWKQLYHKLDLGKYIQNRAIGGMVGIRGKTGITFSPFTAIAYKCLLDFITAKKDHRVFRLHFLGVYNVYDRFHIAILEKLFSLYLGDSIAVKLSYDSAYFANSARMNKTLPVYTLDGTELIYYETALTAPQDVLFKVYNGAGLYQHIQNEIELRRRGHRMRESSSLVPLNIHSNMNIDRHFERLVDGYDLVDLIVKNRSMTVVTSKLQSILEDLHGKLPQLFKRHIQVAIENNIEITHKFHTWFVNNRSYENLDELIKLFIMRIGFPNCIK
jgi:hypothetical protein